MLNELGIEFLWCCAALAPVQYELGNGLFNKRGVYPPALHNFHGVQTRPPIVVQCCRWCEKRFRLILLVPAPAAGDMLAELVFPGVAGFTALAPVENKVFQLRQCELPRDVVIEDQKLQ